MKKLLLYIGNCRQCPNFRQAYYGVDNLKAKYICDVLDDSVINNPDQFLDDCPLENWEGELETPQDREGLLKRLAEAKEIILTLQGDLENEGLDREEVYEWLKTRLS